MRGKEAEGFPAFTLVEIEGRPYREIASEIYEIASEYIFGIYHTTGHHDLVIAWSENLTRGVYADLINKIEAIEGIKNTLTGVTMTQEPGGVSSPRLPLVGIKPEEAVVIQQIIPKVENFLKKHGKETEYFYPSDVAKELKMDYSIVLKIFEQLVEQGKLVSR